MVKQETLAIENFAQTLGAEQEAFTCKAYSTAYRKERLFQRVLYGYWKFAHTQPEYWESALKEVHDIQNSKALAGFFTRLGERTSWLTPHAEHVSSEIEMAVMLSRGGRPIPVRTLDTELDKANKKAGEFVKNGAQIMPQMPEGIAGFLAYRFAFAKMEEAVGKKEGRDSIIAEIAARTIGGIASSIQYGRVNPQAHLMSIFDHGHGIIGEVEGKFLVVRPRQRR